MTLKGANRKRQTVLTLAVSVLLILTAAIIVRPAQRSKSNVSAEEPYWVRTQIDGLVWGMVAKSTGAEVLVERSNMTQEESHRLLNAFAFLHKDTVLQGQGIETATGSNQGRFRGYTICSFKTPAGMIWAGVEENDPQRLNQDLGHLNEINKYIPNFGLSDLHSIPLDESKSRLNLLETMPLDLPAHWYLFDDWNGAYDRTAFHQATCIADLASRPLVDLHIVKNPIWLNKYRNRPALQIPNPMNGLVDIYDTKKRFRGFAFKLGLHTVLVENLQDPDSSRKRVARLAQFLYKHLKLKA